MTTVVVTGGTGTLGSLVVDRLRAGGHEVRILSRHAQPYAVDLREGTGLDAAVGGADAIVHCATTPRGGDEAAAAHLLTAARRAGVPHVVYISIVGVDRLPLAYYAMKYRVERMLERTGEAGPGWTLLRTTQFHDLVLRLLAGMSRLPVLPLPAGVSVQPVDAGEVADRLAELALGPPLGRVPDLGGPAVRPLPDLARAYLAAKGRRRVLLPVRLRGKVYEGYRAGAHLAPGRAVGTVTFEDFLARGKP